MALAPTTAGNALAQHIARSVSVSDPRILRAFASVPREAFLPPALLARAYEDTALPIGLGQTISQPSMIALMLAALAEGGRLVMPVGGSESQILVTCERDDKGTLHYRAGANCVFVPLISDSSPPPAL